MLTRQHKHQTPKPKPWPKPNLSGLDVEMGVLEKLGAECLVDALSLSVSDALVQVHQPFLAAVLLEELPGVLAKSRRQIFPHAEADSTHVFLAKRKPPAGQQPRDHAGQQLDFLWKGRNFRGPNPGLGLSESE